MPPPNGRDITSMMQTPSHPMRSKFKLSMTLGWAQSLLSSLVTLGKTVSRMDYKNERKTKTKENCETSFEVL